jgi:hypothetical protein
MTTVVSAAQDYRTFALKLQDTHCTGVFELGVLVKYVIPSVSLTRELKRLRDLS